MEINRRRFAKILTAAGASLFLPEVGILHPRLAHAAFAEVGSGTQRASVAQGSGPVDADISYPANVTVGNLLMVGGVLWEQPTATSVTVSDTRGSTWNTTLQSTGITVGTGLIRSFISYAIAASSGTNVVSIAPNVTSYISAAIDEFSGPDTGTPLDVDGGISSGTSTGPSDSITTGVANALVIGLLANNAGGPVSITPTSYTTIAELEDGTTFMPYSMVFGVAGAAGAQSVAFTLGSSLTWAVQTMSFKSAVTAAGVARRRIINVP